MECLTEVQSYNIGDKVNFSDLARKYNLTDLSGNIPGNAGQVVKEFLKQNNVDLQGLSQMNREAGEENIRIRRKKRK